MLYENRTVVEELTERFGKMYECWTDDNISSFTDYLEIMRFKGYEIIYVGKSEKNRYEAIFKKTSIGLISDFVQE